MSCKRRSSESKVKLADPRSCCVVFRNESRQEYEITRVDGCVIKDQQSCDYLLTKIGVGSLFVELKGADVAKGAKQIECTILELKRRGELPTRCGSVIIARRCPAFDTTLQRITASLQRHHRVRLKVSKPGKELVFDDFL